MARRTGRARPPDAADRSRGAAPELLAAVELPVPDELAPRAVLAELSVLAGRDDGFLVVLEADLRVVPDADLRAVFEADLRVVLDADLRVVPDADLRVVAEAGFLGGVAGLAGEAGFRAGVAARAVLAGWAVRAAVVLAFGLDVAGLLAGRADPARRAWLAGPFVLARLAALAGLAGLAVDFRAGRDAAASERLAALAWPARLEGCPDRDGRRAGAAADRDVRGRAGAADRADRVAGRLVRLAAFVVACCAIKHSCSPNA
ncbi:MAG TPA: hypothetical protein VH637_20410 [Streptosporangiaceae bacterium]